MSVYKIYYNAQMSDGLFEYGSGVYIDTAAKISTPKEYLNLMLPLVLEERHEFFMDVVYKKILDAATEEQEIELVRHESATLLAAGSAVEKVSTRHILYPALGRL